MRLALVSRRFWPLIGGAEVAMANLAAELQATGHSVTLLTARWDPDWPDHFFHRGVPVVRLPQPRTRGWGTWRYMKELGQWLRRSRDDYDLVFVSMLKHDAYAAMAARRHAHRPVVLRVGGGGETGDCRWHETARFGSRIRATTRHADGFVAVSAALADELIAAEYPPERIRVIPNGVRVDPPRTRASRLRARTDLAEFQPILEVGNDSPVVAYVGRLHVGKGLMELVEAWAAVVRVLPAARLWIVGEGEDGPRVWSHVKQSGLTGTVILPGAFDDPADILEAADLFVLPSHEEGLSMALLEAMSRQVPVVASDIPGNRSVVEHGRTGLLTPPRDPPKLAQSILEALTRSDESARRALQARREIERHHSLATMARRHVEFFESVIERFRPS